MGIFSIGALLGNLEGVSLPGFFRKKKKKKKIYLGSFVGPRGHYDFKSRGHLEL